MRDADLAAVRRKLLTARLTKKARGKVHPVIASQMFLITGLQNTDK